MEQLEPTGWDSQLQRKGKWSEKSMATRNPAITLTVDICFRVAVEIPLKNQWFLYIPWWLVVVSRSF